MENHMTTLKRDNFVFGGLVLGSLFFLFWIIPAQTPEYPGYGVPASLVPNVTVGIILVLSALVLVRNLLEFMVAKKAHSAENQAEDNDTEDRVHLWHLFRFMIPCLLLLPAIQWVGFIPAGIVFMLVIQYVCKQRKPVQVILVAIIPVLLMYVAMRYGLGVPMP